MAVVTLVLVLLVAVVASGLLARLLPATLPTPFVQIAFGAGIGWIGNFGIALEPELFLLLLVPPLLFLDGWRMPKDRLFRDARVILGLALGLVFLTVTGVGFFIHWLIPTMPTAVAFAVAAVVSPTDPVAVSAIARTSPVPTRMMHILEGESLLNDASGLVCLKFAIAAALSGSFVLADAARSFVWMATAGIAAGAFVAWITTRIDAALSWRSDDAGSTILMSVLIPFASYLLAEKIGASGVLAAAAAGIFMTFVQSIATSAAATRLRSRIVWDMLQFALNGVMFVLLGEQIPRIAAHVPDTLTQAGQDSIWVLVYYLAAIMMALIALRFAWVWISLQVMMFRVRRGGRKWEKPPLRWIAAMSCAGARGAITLAGVLTLPLAMADGALFPARELAIFLSSGIIVVSLVIATIGLPLLLRGLHSPVEDRDPRDIDNALSVGAEAAIEAIKRQIEARAGEDAYVDVAATMIEGYRNRLDCLVSASHDGKPDRQAVGRMLRITALQAERNAIIDLRQRHEIGSEAANRLIRRLDLLEIQEAN